MFSNYLKIACRNLLKSKMYSFINIAGLASGMTVALLIGLWIWDELSFDTYHQHYKQLAQVMTVQTVDGETSVEEVTAIPVAEELRAKYPGFKQVALTTGLNDHILAFGDKKVTRPGIWAQPGVPDMFSLHMLKGSAGALNEPSSMLIAESLAKTLFGDADPLNKTLRIDNTVDMKIAGVYADLPNNTTIGGTEFLMPWSKYLTLEDWLKKAQIKWDNHSFLLYVQLHDQVDPGQMSAKIRNVPTRHVESYKEELLLHPMANWRLHSEFANSKPAGGRIRFVWLFGIIGVFVLLLACINFMNLSTAKSEKRAREVGIRKSLGSLRSQLVGQFFSESLLMALLALAVALLLLQLSLPFFNGLADKQMLVPAAAPLFWLLMVAFTLFTGLLAGSYPALYLSGFQPLKVLKGTFRTGRLASIPRKVLVIVQFTVSITLIIGTLIVYRQIQHAKDRPVGYTRAGLITVDMNTPDIYGHYNAIRNDLLQTGAVENMAESSSSVTHLYSNNNGFDWRGKDPAFIPFFRTVGVTHDFGKTIGWHITAGRDFSRSFPADTGAVILNETAARQTGLKDPVGEVLKWNGKDHIITGVVKDMLTQSPYEPMEPSVFFLNYNWAEVITIRINPAMPLREALAKIEPVFKKYDPASPFGYKFADEVYARKYSDEERIGHLSTFFAVLAVFISCLGLFGLAAFVAEQRTKEIGVRKVLGASVFQLWKMLSGDFVALVLISCCAAIPLAWYFLDEWLQHYRYRTQISWWIFAIAGAGAVLITLLTVSYQAIRAAHMNPVKSLRSE